MFFSWTLVAFLTFQVLIILRQRAFIGCYIHMYLSYFISFVVLLQMKKKRCKSPFLLFIEDVQSFGGLIMFMLNLDLKCKDLGIDSV